MRIRVRGTRVLTLDSVSFANSPCYRSW